MPVLTIDSDDGGARREVEVRLHRGGRSLAVVRMFDSKGSETFDATEAVEVESEGNLLDLQEGDHLLMSVLIEFLDSARTDGLTAPTSQQAGR